MATLSADKPRIFEVGHDNAVNALPVIAADIIYDGAAVGESSTSGTYRPLVGGDTFAGFAIAQADNSAGAASDIRVKVYQKGTVLLTITGVDNANDVDAAVYATDDDTFTLTASGGTQIGKIQRVVDTSAGTAMVYFEAVSVRSI